MVKHFRPYLEGREFVLESDAQALQSILRNDSHNSRLARWAIILRTKGVQFCYRKGEDMADADALSRHPLAPEESQEPEAYEEELDLYSEVVSESLQNQWDAETEEQAVLANIFHASQNEEEPVLPVGLQEIKEAQAQDMTVQEIIGWLDTPKELRTKPRGPIGKFAPQCQVIDGLLYRCEQDPETKATRRGMWIPKVKDLRKRILAFGDGSVTTGHPGINNTIDRLRIDYFWPEMQRNAAKWARRCHNCQIRKATTKDPGQVMSITVDNPNDLWSVDLVGPLKATHRNARYILTMVDHFSRFADAIPITSKKAREVAQGILVLTARHGTPRKILSDKGGEFKNAVMETLQKDLRLKGISTSGYAPQTNGKVERFHRTLGNMLSFLVSREEDDWDENLPLAIFAYNTQVHSATGYTPFYLNHLREARHPWQEVPRLAEAKRTPESWGTEMAQKAAKVYDQVRRRLDAQRAKVEAQREALEPLLQRIQLGDLVLLKKEVTTKLGPRFEGPAKVVEVSNKGLNYRLEFPSGKKTKPIHIRRLQKYHGSAPPPEITPSEPQEFSPVLVPGKALRKGRKAKNDDGDIAEMEVESIENEKGVPGEKQFLVHWKGLSKEHRTWEPADKLMENCGVLIREFHDRRRSQRAKGRGTRRRTSKGVTLMATSPLHSEGNRPASLLIRG